MPEVEALAIELARRSSSRHWQIWLTVVMLQQLAATALVEPLGRQHL